MSLRSMTIEIRNPAIEARLRKQVAATASGSVEEALLRMLDAQEEQDRWLAENRAGIDQKIRRGVEQLERGEGIHEGRRDLKGKSRIKKAASFSLVALDKSSAQSDRRGRPSHIGKVFTPKKAKQAML